jgi:hypothetical protein
MQSERSGGECVVGVASVIADGSALLRASVFWFLLLTLPDEDLPLAWVLTLAFGLVCIAAAVSLRRLLRARLSSRQRETLTAPHCVYTYTQPY